MSNITKNRAVLRLTTLTLDRWLQMSLLKHLQESFTVHSFTGNTCMFFTWFPSKASKYKVFARNCRFAVADLWFLTLCYKFLSCWNWKHPDLHVRDSKKTKCTSTRHDLCFCTAADARHVALLFLELTLRFRQRVLFALDITLQWSEKQMTDKHLN
jgi:hypothetical protein